MDIHRNLNATVDDVWKAHRGDLEAQEKFNVKYLKYWFNPQAGTVCCLVHAPNPEAASACHMEAHGLVADRIIEVQEDVVEAFLGDSVDAEKGRMVARGGQSDGGFRTILFSDLAGSTDLNRRLGDEATMRVLHAHDAILRREIESRRGLIIKHTGDGFMASFADASSAIQAAIAIQRALNAQNQQMPEMPILVRIGINAGEPVDEGNDLFGAAVQLARRVCDAAEAERIYVANVVRELCLGKSFAFQDLGHLQLKGFSDPVRLHEIGWRDASPDGGGRESRGA
jgi:class 3 adenylate cyclase